MGSAVSGLTPYLPPALGILAPFPGSIARGIIARKNIKIWYDKSLKKPSWRPPNWVFGPIWTILYATMGFASYLVWRDGGGFKGPAYLPLALYASQLALNWMWTPLFFGAKKLDWAFVDIVLLDVNIAACIWTFKDINTTASLLLAPYMAWVSFVSILNYWIYVNNKDDKHKE